MAPEVVSETRPSAGSYASAMKHLQSPQMYRQQAGWLATAFVAAVFYFLRLCDILFLACISTGTKDASPKLRRKSRRVNGLTSRSRRSQWTRHHGCFGCWNLLARPQAPILVLRCFPPRRGNNILAQGNALGKRR